MPTDQPITIIYGHTHLADIFEPEEINDAVDQQNRRCIVVRGFWGFLRYLQGKNGMPLGSRKKSH